MFFYFEMKRLFYAQMLESLKKRLKKVYSSKNKISEQFIEEEVLNVLTHLPAVFVFSFLGGYLIAKTQYPIANFIFILSLVNLYSFSVMYHAIQKIKLKKLFQLYDHISIYLLIGGTYTPILAYLNEYTALNYIWIIIFIGIIERIFLFIRNVTNLDAMFLTKCILTGIFITSLKSFWNNVPSVSFWLVLIGGFFYAFGSYFFISKKLYAHVKWHVMVLIGSVCHFMAVYCLTKI